MNALTSTAAAGLTPRAGDIVGATFEAIGTTNAVLVTRPEVLPEAVDLAKRHLREVDRAVSRFRPDSEVSLLAERARRAPAEAFVSPTFAAYLQAGLRVARLTGGLVDPTVGSALVVGGYDADLEVVRHRTPFHQVRVAGVPHWHTIHLNASARRVSVAPGTLIDLGASAKAYAADTIAALLARTLTGGFAVNLGGDIAVSGELPARGWSIGIEDASGATREVVTSTGQAIATSSTQRRVWQTDNGTAPPHRRPPHRPHRLDGLVAGLLRRHQRLEANAASTAAIVLGADAPDWLVEHGIPARLETLDGHVVTTPGWPDASTRGA